MRIYRRPNTQANRVTGEIETKLHVRTMAITGRIPRARAILRREEESGRGPSLGAAQEGAWGHGRGVGC